MAFKSYLTFTLCFFYMLGACFFYSFSFLLYFVLPTKWYYQLDAAFYSFTQRGIIFLFEDLNVQKLHIYGDISLLEKSKRENVIFMSNHSSTIDWVIPDLITGRMGILGKLRFIIGHIYKYIPYFGFYGLMHGYVFVNRNKFDVKLMNQTTQFIKDKNIPYWMVIYPEGKIMNPQRVDLYTKAVRYAKKVDVEPFLYHLTPRVTGMKLILDNLEGSVDAIIDCTIVYADSEGRPLDRRYRIPGTESWNDQVKSIFIHVERIPIKDVPKDTVDAWVYDRFRIKDRLMKNLFERDRYLDNPDAPSEIPDTFSDWSTLVKYQPPSYEYTQECFSKLLKPTENLKVHPELANLFNPDGTLRRIGFTQTALPWFLMSLWSAVCLHPRVLPFFLTTITTFVFSTLAYLRLFVL